MNFHFWDQVHVKVCTTLYFYTLYHGGVKLWGVINMDYYKFGSVAQKEPQIITPIILT